MARFAAVSSREGAATPIAAAIADRLPRPASAERRAAASGPAAFEWVGGGDGGMAQRDGIMVVLDGTIYGAADAIAAATDAELVLDLHLRFGFENALRRLNGDFAIALHDAASDTLWVARDRFGVKPAYYAQTAATFACASQPRSLLAVAGVSDAVDPDFVGLYAAGHYRYVDDPARSPYAAIAQLPPAHVLRVRDGRTTLGRYWKLEDVADLDLTDAELAERYRELLLDAVSIRLARAPAMGFTLSGGLDSSSVLASAVFLSGARQHALSTVYPDSTYDERDEIRPMLDAAVAEWHAVEVDPGPSEVLELVAKMVVLHDEPVITATWLSHFLLCETAGSLRFQSLFGGLGGDELNAGEYEYFPYHFADLRQAGLDDELEAEIEAWVGYHDHPVFRKSRAGADFALELLTNPSRPGECYPDRARLERYADAVLPEFFDLRAWQPVLESPFESYLKNRTYHDLTRETAPSSLRAQDRNSNAFGLANLLPFLDYRLAEFMYRVPGRAKIRGGVTKRLLREAMAGILPDETRLRVKKTGWNAPAHVWFSGAGREQILDLVRSQAFRERGIYDVATVERIVDEHDRIVRSGKARENHMMFLWQLVNLELWLRSLK